MSSCPECDRLREASAIAFADYLSARDDVAMTRKTDSKALESKRRALKGAEGRFRDFQNQEAHHRDVHRYGEACQEDVAPKLARLRERIEIEDSDAVRDAIFDLSPTMNGWKGVPDQVVEELLTILRSDRMYTSHVAGHLLNYFEFESSHLTPKQKLLCLGFLQAHGDQFTHVHSQQVVTELRHDSYLKPKGR